MKIQSFTRKYIVAWLRIVLVIAVLIAPFGASTASAQAVPPACVTDQGVVPMPGPAVGAWTMVLNFNHPKSSTGTVACLITTVGLNPQQVSYTTPIQCLLQNNVNNVQVGAGSAPFDGDFWIGCPTAPQPPGAGPLYDYFHVTGRAKFSTEAASYTLFQHADVDVQVDVDENWHVKLHSRYGNTSFDNVDLTTNVAGVDVRLESQVMIGTGAHYVNGTQLQPTATVAPFPFDFFKPFTIGSPGKPWKLYEIVIDPPPRCCLSP